MAFAIVAAALGAGMAGDQWDGLPGNLAKLTDQTNNSAQYTSALITFAAAVRQVRAQVWIKTYAQGTASAGPQLELVVADNSGFTTNLRTVASGVLGRRPGDILLNGVVPDNFLAQWAKLVITNGPGGSATDSFTFDAQIDAF